MTPYDSGFHAIRPPEPRAKTGYAAAWVWEPGDATHYEFILTHIPAGDRDRTYVTLLLSGRGSTMELPAHAVIEPIAPEYIGAKTGLGAYEARVFSDFCAHFYQTPLYAMQED
jgi:hypothetical protein